MSLQGRLDALRTKFETEMAPPEMVGVMQRVTQDLIASGVDMYGRGLTLNASRPPVAP